MFGDIGWAELMVIGIVALIVIGPEDLPDMFRQVGRFTAKLRQMSRDFSRAMDQAAKDSGVKDVAKDMKAMTSPASLGINKFKAAADRFEKWDPIKSAVKPTVAFKPLVPAPMPATPVPAPAVTDTAVTEAAAAPVAVIKPAALGPATQAFADKQAAKAVILKDVATRLKAVDVAASEVAAEPAAKPASKSRVRSPKTSDASEPVAPKPRAATKIKKADQV